MIAGGGRPAAATRIRRRARARLAVALAALAALTLAVFWPLRHAGFVVYDDGYYVTGNPRVLRGLTWEGVRWAFASWGSAENSHPLSWISHQLDVRLFGLDAGAHHLENVLLHTANALLLLALLHRLTGAFWRSALAAALFAVHPLRVESVAWISERKDVLSALFGLLALGAYLRFVRRPGPGRALAVAVPFALALLAKPMLMTLPVLLLVLDFWPLGRLPLLRAGALPGALAARLAEKAPLFALSAVSLLMTTLAHRNARVLQPLEPLGLFRRLAIVVESYASYLGTLAWPDELWIPYLRSTAFPPWRPVAAALLLAVLSVLVARAARRAPEWLAGWAWYAAALVPVSGIARLGDHVRADRYTYLPLVGISVAIAWTLARAAARRGPWVRAGTAAVAAGAVLALAARAHRQAGFWHDSERLLGHTLAADPGNWVAHNLYGILLGDRGDAAAALRHYRAAAAASPRTGLLVNLAILLEQEGAAGEAEAVYERALAHNPASAPAHYGFANYLAHQGRLEEAAREYAAALRLEPGLSDAHNNLGVVLGRLGRKEEARRHHGEAVRANPLNAEARNNYGVALLRAGEVAEALAQLREAVRLKPAYLAALRNLADALQAAGQAGEAQRWRAEARRLGGAGTPRGEPAAP